MALKKGGRAYTLILRFFGLDIVTPREWVGRDTEKLRG
jgi:hypothetical protein